MLIAAFPALAADISVRVVGIAYGEMISVLTAEKRQVRIRLAGIDAPERDHDLGSLDMTFRVDESRLREQNLR